MKHTIPDNVSTTDLSHLIDEWVFSERDRAILKRRYIDGLCFEELADEFNLSVPQIKTITYRQSEKVFKHL